MESLYEIDQAITSLIDQETGELLDLEAFEKLQMERDRKIEGVALWYKDTIGDAKKIKEEIDNLTDRHNKLKRRADGLKKYIDHALSGKAFSTARCTVSYRQSSSVKVDNECELIKWAEENGHRECVRYKAPEVSKSAVSDLIKSGVEVPFASIQKKRSVIVK